MVLDWKIAMLKQTPSYRHALPTSAPGVVVHAPNLAMGTRPASNAIARI